MTEPTVERTWERENTMETVWGEDAWLWSRRRSQVGGVYEAVVPLAVEEAIRADERSKWESAVEDALVDALSLSSTGLMLAALERRLRSLLDPKDSQ